MYFLNGAVGIFRQFPIYSTRIAFRKFGLSFRYISSAELKEENEGGGQRLGRGRGRIKRRTRLMSQTMDQPSPKRIIEQDPPWYEKILWSSHLEAISHPKSNTGKKIAQFRTSETRRAEAIIKSRTYLPLSLRYSNDEELLKRVPKDEEEEEATPEREDKDNYQFPYEIVTNVTSSENRAETEAIASPKKDDINNEEEKAKEGDPFWYRGYGDPDPSIPPSRVPCGGCGAVLHCQDTSIAGYLPAETFKRFKEEELRGEICQRCYFLREHDTALSVNVSPQDYIKVLSEIKHKDGLVLLVIDLLDFPVSIWPGIINLIGPGRPVILVGNKVDLIMKDCSGYLEHIQEVLRNEAENMGLDKARIIHTALVSATTGFGIEDLISNIFSKWRNRGDIYIMGCTNVGKSSLFNAFLQSDLCTVQAVDLVQRATVSKWPGTTLNLLKFPIMYMHGWKMKLRSIRLKNKENSEESQIEAHQKKDEKNPLFATLIGHIGRTFLSEDRLKSITIGERKSDMFSMNALTRFEKKPKPVGNYKPDMPTLRGMFKWCFDTPGSVSRNQILGLFTLEELMILLPKSLIMPRTFYMRPGMTLFVGGVARVDYLEAIKGEQPIRFTVFASSSLPITIVGSQEDADEVYQKALGTEIFKVPIKSSEDRIKRFPPLEGVDLTFNALYQSESCADVLLSSIGWVAITPEVRHVVKIRVHTPGKRGIYARIPSILPFAVNIRGKRIRDTPAYEDPVRLPVQDSV